MELMRRKVAGLYADHPAQQKRMIIRERRGKYVQLHANCGLNPIVVPWTVQIEQEP